MRTQPLLAIVTCMLILGTDAWPTTGIVHAASPRVPASMGTTIEVNTFADELNIDGNCSLREAIQAANTDQKFDECPAGQGADTIELLAGTYTLTLPGADEEGNATGDLDMHSDLALHGVWSGVTIIDGNQLDRVLHVHGGAAVQVSGVTIRNGLTPSGLDDQNGGGDGGDGGGIWNEGNLALLDCSVLANHTGKGGDGFVSVGRGRGGRGGRGGGIANTGVLALTLSVVTSNVTGDGGVGGEGGDAPEDTGDGGGIFNIGQMIITASTVRDNRAGDGGGVFIWTGSWGGDGGDGGGIANHGQMTLVASTVSGNTAGPSGPELTGRHVGGAGGDGGGIYNHGTTAWLTLVNSTVSGNQAGHGGDSWGRFPGGPGGDGGGIYNDALLTASNATVTSNLTGDGGSGELLAVSGAGGGIYNQNSAEVRNTILAGNTAGGTESDCEHPLTSKGYNFVQSITGCVLAGDLTGNIIGREPRLGPLANYGGPTWTHALLPLSPAVDAGSCIGLDGSPVTWDQRAASRPQGRGCDIGAYEGTFPPYLFLPLMRR